MRRLILILTFIVTSSDAQATDVDVQNALRLSEQLATLLKKEQLPTLQTTIDSVLKKVSQLEGWIAKSEALARTIDVQVQSGKPVAALKEEHRALQTALATITGISFSYNRFSEAQLKGKQPAKLPPKSLTDLEVLKRRVDIGVQASVEGRNVATLSPETIRLIQDNKIKSNNKAQP